MATQDIGPEQLRRLADELEWVRSNAKGRQTKSKARLARYEEMAAEAEWLAGISAELPLHLSRYFPRYQSRIPMTPVETLQNLRHVAEARLRFVHLGNI